MTRSLIIDCHLSPTKTKQLSGAVKRFGKCTIVEFEGINSSYKVDKDIDAIVMSGSEARIVKPSDRARFIGTLDLMRDLQLLLFSICFGHQLLCWSFGASVAYLSDPVKDRFEKVRIIRFDEIFDGFQRDQLIPLAEWHYDYVLKGSLKQAGCVLLADSYSCEVEAVKHENYPFYGVQFHPERVEIKGQSHLEGQKIIQNFYKNVVKR